MKPKFATIETWQQAELLMQPAFIRLIDNLRKQLDSSTWRGTYQDVQIWADDISDETKARVLQLRQQLETASPEQTAEIEAELSQMPSPYPGYELHLEKDDRQIKVDLWELCYRICFRSPMLDEHPVDIDTHLIDETGDVDWNQLEEKTKQIVEQVFATLPE
ncbi:hypothetical protein Q2T42_25440 [Leptolyngbya boryana CZ1]|jgi:hypothetical protein|uniref:Uncharacterized protein n=2 Tax=Leptolyngbya boryana TaxID=1184 RepID=A0A1Z4JGY8_LEPBY|nr:MULTISPECIES: hypothetical protein [Leptolyngbya]BAY55928.1 hypothetical protein NIES2135_27550 [Leptolyngbya boryana NIES-2135]MBD2368773.1 hypothetical protein [Leptolyngbya sp. FACHB-161]MBD2375359.1 hypothetical protein [Leptolyngbya sp. FACHB-238]MBD2399777.1 hypothetical protein [Leptolyngbya sp. FACHB-239]MBD2405983.1 hypothetical protein [Leptolyngbya sp. FACHB-402]